MNNKNPRYNKNFNKKHPKTLVMENHSTPRSTSWGKEALWYDNHLSGKDTYHHKVILPNLIKLIGPKHGMHITDMATGQGFFARAFAEAGATVTAFDLSKKLIETAKNHPENSPKNKITYHVTPAEKSDAIKDASADVLTLILAIQNIKDLNGVAKQIYRILKKDGRAYIVLNHPAFRIPKLSSWQFDNRNDVQYRRLDGYLKEKTQKIDMHPGKTASGYLPSETISFHRPIQSYANAFSKNNLAITNIFEWISHRKSEPGKRQVAEDVSRNEFPLFMCLELKKLN